MPSSPFLTRQTAKFLDFSKARTVVELGPGEGCHSRQIVRRMKADSRLILIELDAHFAAHLKNEFAHDPRVSVMHADAIHLTETLDELGVTDPDYIVSGLPFTIMERDLRDRLLSSIAHAMGPRSRFITYQVSLQISRHGDFDLLRREHCLLNVPPIHVMELARAS